MKNISKEINSIRMDSFPIETLNNMEQQLQYKQEHLILLSKEILRSIKEKLSKLRWNIQKNFRKLP